MSNTQATVTKKPDFESVKQLTKEQAIALHDSEVWKTWTKEQICDFQMWQRFLCVPFGVFQEAVEATLGRSVWTHEFGLAYAEMQQERLGKRKPPTFAEIIELIPAEKRIMLCLED